MRNAAGTVIGALAALACASSVRAHHSGSMYVTTATWIKGTVVAFDDVNPHSIITLEERGADGEALRWAIEGPRASAPERTSFGADLPKPGDTLELCAFGYKTPEELSSLFPAADFSARQPRAGTDGSLAGHVLVLPDGELRVWEPHGLLSECIRSSDKPRQSWLDLFRSSARARELWCDQRRHAAVRASTALQDIVMEIDAALPEACE